MVDGSFDVAQDMLDKIHMDISGRMHEETSLLNNKANV
jgi:hypothetical protein